MRAHTVAMLVALSAGAAVAPAAQAATSDLSASITLKTKHATKNRRVEFIVTITNNGPDPTSGVQLSVDFRGGFDRAKLVSAPPDTVTLAPGPSCPAPFGFEIPCVPEPTPPVCHTTSTSIACTYDANSPFLTTTGNDSRVAIAVSAVAGKRRHEMVIASGTSSSSDPNQSNNEAKLKVTLGR